jgi:hypothetical protein
MIYHNVTIMICCNVVIRQKFAPGPSSSHCVGKRAMGFLLHMLPCNHKQRCAQKKGFNQEDSHRRITSSLSEKAHNHKRSLKKRLLMTSNGGLLSVLTAGNVPVVVRDALNSCCVVLSPPQLCEITRSLSESGRPKRESDRSKRAPWSHAVNLVKQAPWTTPPKSC